jgi:chromosome segregation ATPase
MLYKEIKEKVTSLSDKLSREKGARDQLMEQMKKLLDNPNATPADVEVELQALATKKDKLEVQKEKVMEKLEAVTDWSKA